jgi:hypothetical protein
MGIECSGECYKCPTANTCSRPEKIDLSKLIFDPSSREQLFSQPDLEVEQDVPQIDGFALLNNGNEALKAYNALTSNPEEAIQDKKMMSAIGLCGQGLCHLCPSTGSCNKPENNAHDTSTAITQNNTLSASETSIIESSSPVIPETQQPSQKIRKTKQRKTEPKRTFQPRLKDHIAQSSQLTDNSSDTTPNKEITALKTTPTHEVIKKSPQNFISPNTVPIHQLHNPRWEVTPISPQEKQAKTVVNISEPVLQNQPIVIPDRKPIPITKPVLSSPMLSREHSTTPPPIHALRREQFIQIPQKPTAQHEQVNMLLQTIKNQSIYEGSTEPKQKTVPSKAQVYTQTVYNNERQTPSVPLAQKETTVIKKVNLSPSPNIQRKNELHHNNYTSERISPITSRYTNEIHHTVAHSSEPIRIQQHTQLISENNIHSIPLRTPVNHQETSTKDVTQINPNEDMKQSRPTFSRQETRVQKTTLPNFIKNVNKISVQYAPDRPQNMQIKTTDRKITSQQTKLQEPQGKKIFTEKHKSSSQSHIKSKQPQPKHETTFSIPFPSPQESRTQRTPLKETKINIKKISSKEQRHTLSRQSNNIRPESISVFHFKKPEQTLSSTQFLSKEKRKPLVQTSQKNDIIKNVNRIKTSKNNIQSNEPRVPTSEPKNTAENSKHISPSTTTPDIPTNHLDNNEVSLTQKHIMKALGELLQELRVFRTMTTDRSSVSHDRQKISSSTLTARVAEEELLTPLKSKPQQLVLTPDQARLYAWTFSQMHRYNVQTF